MDKRNNSVAVAPPEMTIRSFWLKDLKIQLSLMEPMSQ